MIGRHFWNFQVSDWSKINFFSNKKLLKKYGQLKYYKILLFFNLTSFLSQHLKIYWRILAVVYKQGLFVHAYHRILDSKTSIFNILISKNCLLISFRFIIIIFKSRFFSSERIKNNLSQNCSKSLAIFFSIFMLLYFQ